MANVIIVWLIKFSFSLTHIGATGGGRRGEQGICACSIMLVPWPYSIKRCSCIDLHLVPQNTQ